MPRAHPGVGILALRSFSSPTTCTPSATSAPALSPSKGAGGLRRRHRAGYRRLSRLADAPRPGPGARALQAGTGRHHRAGGAAGRPRPAQAEQRVGGSVTVRIHYCAQEPVQDPVFNVALHVLNGQQVTEIRSDSDGLHTATSAAAATSISSCLRCNLLPNIYTIDAESSPQRWLHLLQTRQPGGQLQGGGRLAGQWNHLSAPHLAVERPPGAASHPRRPGHAGRDR